MITTTWSLIQKIIHWGDGDSESKGTEANQMLLATESHTAPQKESKKEMET